MKENEKPSKVYLIRQEQSLNNGIEPVYKDFLFDCENGYRVDKDGTSPLALPVGYVIVHDNYGVHEMHGDNFEVVNNIVSRPIYAGVDISHLEGELLTIIDAAFADKQQRESIKSLIRNTVWQFNSRQEKKIQAMYESIKD